MLFQCSTVRYIVDSLILFNVRFSCHVSIVRLFLQSPSICFGDDCIPVYCIVCELDFTEGLV